MKRVFTQPFVIVAAILEKDGNFMLVKEAKKDNPDHGKWNHPAGWVDLDENPIEAVKREVLEETGLIFTPTNILGVYSLVRNDVEKEFGLSPQAIKIVFTGTFTEKENSVIADDISDNHWFSEAEIKAMDATALRDADIKEMIDDYLNGSKFSLSLIKHSFAKK